MGWISKHASNYLKEDMQPDREVKRWKKAGLYLKSRLYYSLVLWLILIQSDLIEIRIVIHIKATACHYVFNWFWLWLDEPGFDHICDCCESISLKFSNKTKPLVSALYSIDLLYFDQIKMMSGICGRISPDLFPFFSPSLDCDAQSQFVAAHILSISCKEQNTTCKSKEFSTHSFQKRPAILLLMVR